MKTKVIASIVAKVTIPADLAQSAVVSWISWEQSQRDVGLIGRAWFRRMVAQNIAVPGKWRFARLIAHRSVSGCTEG